jgi:glucose/arabinose dehydrogenase
MRKTVTLVSIVAAAMALALPAMATDTAGAVNPAKGHWTLRAENGNSTTIGYGVPGDRPFMGDWDCDGTDTPGLYRQTQGFVYLRDSNTTGVADVSYFFGIAGDLPVVGDFDGDGCDTVSIYRPSEGRFYVINHLGTAFAEYSYFFGVPGDVPMMGDWNGDGTDSPGLRRPSDGFVYLRNSNTTGFADISFFYGVPGDLPIAGDWDGDNDDTIGLYRPTTRTFYLRNVNSTGVADVSYTMGDPGSLPVAGDFGLSLPPPPPPLGLQTVITGLSSPLFVSAPPGDGRLFVVEQTGDIEIVENGVRRSTPFLDLSVTSGGERGLLGLAFHPGYAQNGRFYVNYTIGSVSRISEFTVSGDPDLADPGSERVLIEVTQPFTNHNGGMLAFDAEGNLLIGLGDGGGGGDPGNRAQNPNNLLGKVLRIDVDGLSPGKQYAIPEGNPYRNGGGAPEVYLLGARNPWRFGVDSGNLYVGDVGQGAREEVTVLHPGIQAGANLGWRVWEGSHCFAGPCFVGGYVFPQVEYTHADGCSVTGGFVYRGDDIPGLAGTYFYGDFCGGWIRSFRYENSVVGPLTLRSDLGTVGSLSSFGFDGQGELYITSLSGAVYRIVADT